MKKTNVYLVGAGPGDVELLTLKAVKILEQADVVLYDALVNIESLYFCKKDVITVNVGKRKDKHLLIQNEINELILKYAKEDKLVVRLKGGTPFVFGRGYEEINFLNQHGIDVEVISGVSSTTAVPESFNIALIDRNYSDAYRTITGHDINIFKAIVTHFHERENLIIMMGAHNTKIIVTHLLEIGFPHDLPIAFLSQGTTENATKIISNLEEVSKKESVFFEKLRSLTPIIIYIGRTINAQKSFSY